MWVGYSERNHLDVACRESFGTLKPARKGTWISPMIKKVRTWVIAVRRREARPELKGDQSGNCWEYGDSFHAMATEGASPRRHLHPDMTREAALWCHGNQFQSSWSSRGEQTALYPFCRIYRNSFNQQKSIPEWGMVSMVSQLIFR